VQIRNLNHLSYNKKFKPFELQFKTLKYFCIIRCDSFLGIQEYIIDWYTRRLVNTRFKFLIRKIGRLVARYEWAVPLHMDQECRPSNQRNVGRLRLDLGAHRQKEEHGWCWRFGWLGGGLGGGSGHLWRWMGGGWRAAGGGGPVGVLYDVLCILERRLRVNGGWRQRRSSDDVVRSSRCSIDGKKDWGGEVDQEEMVGSTKGTRGGENLPIRARNPSSNGGGSSYFSEQLEQPGGGDIRVLRWEIRRGVWNRCDFDGIGSNSGDVRV
jgi:hypothetical protein